MADSNSSQLTGETLLLVSAAAAIFPTLQLLLSAANNSAEGFRASLHNSNLAAQAGLAQTAASVDKLLDDPAPAPQAEKRESARTSHMSSVESYGRLAVT